MLNPDLIQTFHPVVMHCQVIQKATTNQVIRLTSSTTMHLLLIGDLRIHWILNMLRWLARKLKYCWIIYTYHSDPLTEWIGRLLHGQKTKQIILHVLRIVWVMIHFLHSLIIINQRFLMVSISVQYLKVIILPCQVVYLWLLKVPSEIWFCLYFHSLSK